MFIICFLFWVSPFCFYFFIFYGLTHHPPPATRHPLPATRLPATRHPPPVTRHPPPATRHPRKSPAAAMLVSQTSPVGVELFSYANTFFCSNKFALMLAT